jgi:tetratricopeptide (TPR) repeat protein
MALGEVSNGGCLDQMIRLAPGDPEAFYNRSLTYEDKGDRAKAMADYTAALAAIANGACDLNGIADKARARLAASKQATGHGIRPAGRRV